MKYQIKPGTKFICICPTCEDYPDDEYVICKKLTENTYMAIPVGAPNEDYIAYIDHIKLV